jgi:hypothetical protein
VTTISSSAGVSADSVAVAAIASVPSVNGNHIAINAGFKLGTYRLPAPFRMAYFMGRRASHRQNDQARTTENESKGKTIAPIYFRILAFDVIVIFEIVKRHPANLPAI